ncbi:DUF386 domain-containing protein [Oenococcus sicerae]|uniref:DUF386 domain-containing protein n=1 Tax=Oenococcus sicerae TaxID=2203724 RepID=A0ABX5QKL1_9LACO|nr:YhcH/YjgK/YiaL family protein [Oenococcus sicerae]QAS69303.1 DUF386 domain-containing protein [Oenococcus sicerae]
MEFELGKNYKRDSRIQARIKTAIDWLENHTIEELLSEPIGPKVIADGVELRFQSYDSRDYKDMNYETHQDHIDIHYMIQGAEYVRWSDIGNTQAVSNYDAQEDIQFFAHPQHHGKALLTDRHFAIFYPTDLHAAHGMVNGKSEHNHKLCVKIAIN